MEARLWVGAAGNVRQHHRVSPSHARHFRLSPCSWSDAGSPCIALGSRATQMAGSRAGLALAPGFSILLRPAVGLAAVALAIPFGNFVQLPGFGINGVDVSGGIDHHRLASAWDRRPVPRFPSPAADLVPANLRLVRGAEPDASSVVARRAAGMVQVGRVRRPILGRHPDSGQAQRDLDTRRPVCRRGPAGRLGDLPVRQPGGAGSVHHSGTLHACLRHFQPAEPLRGIPGLSLSRSCQPDV